MNQIALVRLVTLISALICLPSHAGVEDRPWYHYQSTHFEVYSNDKPKDVAQKIRDLESFRAVVLSVVGFDQDKVVSELPTKVIVFRRGADMQNVFKMSKNTGGFFAPRFHENLMVTGAVRGGIAGENDSIFHEYVHFLSRSLTSFANPLWYDEGLADVLSTIKSEDGSMVVGTVPMDRVYTLATQPALKLETVLNAKQYSDLTKKQRIRFYAKAWLFVHFMNFSVNSQQLGLPDKLVQLVQRAQLGESYEVLFPELLGMTMRDMDKALAKYAKGRSVLHRYPAAKFAVNEDFAQRRMSTNEVRELLAEATSYQNPKMARKMLRKALKQEPDNARVLAGLGNTHTATGEFDEALDYLEQALELAPEDYRIRIDYGVALSSQCSQQFASGNCENLEVLRQVYTQYEQSYNLAPTLIGPNRVYGYALMDSGYFQEALDRYRFALALQPSNAVLNRQVGFAHLKLGNLSEARSYLERAQAWAGHSAGTNPWLDDVFEELAAAEAAASEQSAAVAQ